MRERALRGGSFSSAIDARWTVRSRTGGGGYETFALSSTGSRLDREGIPRAGAIGITLTEGAARTIARGAPAGQTPQPQATGASGRARAAMALLSEVVRTPARAQEVVLSVPPRLRTLAGASAAEETYEYLYRGRGNVQVDVVASRGGKVYFIELDTELAHIGPGESALSRLLRAWRWR